MANALLSESVLDKTATLALGCCIASGVVAISPVAAPVVSAAVSLGAVLGALGLRKVIGEQPECEKAWKTVRRQLPRNYPLANDADEAAVHEAARRLDEALDQDGIFAVEALKQALQRSADVVEGLTLNALDALAARDATFAAEGLHRDLARALFSEGFSAALAACSSFSGQATLATAQTILAEGRRSSRKLADIKTMMEDFIATGRASKAEAAGLNEAQVLNLLTAFAIEGVPLDQAEGLLLKAAAEIRELRSQLVRLSNADPATTRLKQDAAKAIDEGRLDDAKALILEAAVRHRLAGEELADALKTHKLAEAEALAEAAQLDHLQARHEDAAALYAEAAIVAAPFDAGAAWRWRLHQAFALNEHGRLFPGLASLSDAIFVLRNHCLPQTPRESSPLAWAGTQNNLGNVLKILGERAGGEVGLAALYEAVDACRKALEVYTRKDMPTDWAMTQSNLGAALRVLGAQVGGEAGLTALNDAVGAYRSALEVHTRKDMPIDWAMTQNNLGIALTILGERTDGEAGLAALNAAVDTHRSALEVCTRKDMPIDWAKSLNNLGAALRSLGIRVGGEAGLAALSDAVGAYRSTLEVRTRKDMPADWASTQNNLGNALGALGERTDGEAGLAALNAAIEAYRSALEVYTRKDMPAQWAMTQNNLGGVLRSLGIRADNEAGLIDLNDALGAYRSALKVRTRKDMPADWAFSTENLALTEWSISETTREPAPLREAILRMEAVIPVYTAMQATYYVEKARRSLFYMRAMLQELDPSPS